ncbi:MAG: ribosome biogenesis GTPase Der [Patescibacteria group bacterium]|jgi:GTP-binding protein
MPSLQKHNLPLVVLCGRTNVGKSTLFNRLTEKNQALVSNIPGTTRDSNLGIVEWANSAFELVDTAGIINWKFLEDKKMVAVEVDDQSQKQAVKHLNRADLILFIVDNKAGLLPEDKEIARALRKNPNYSQKTLVVANKVDSFQTAEEAAIFNKLGLGEPLTTSAVSSMGTGDLLDIIVNRLDKQRQYQKPVPDKALVTIKACLVGKPNVGKSSLLNSLLGYERVIVSPVAHTTRESQDITLRYQDRLITLIDTAGISRQGKKSKGLEKPGILQSLSSLARADIAILVLDISEPITHQDAKIIQEVVDRQKSLIIIANKWDQVEERDTKKWTTAIYDKFPFVSWAPLQFLSAKTGEKVNRLLNILLKVADERALSLSDSQCTKFLNQVVKIHKPAKGKGLKAPRIYEFRQIKSNPPSFIVRIGPNDDLHFSYVRFMENRLREKYGFTGTPIKTTITKERRSHTTYNY